MGAHRTHLHRLILLRMALALVLVLALAHPAQGTRSSSSSSSWQLRRWRSLLAEDAADESDSSSSPTTIVRLVAVLAPRVTASSSSSSNNTAVGSSLHAWDQCGGSGGLCNQTTIGVPCGDQAWQSVNCPQNFTCTRRDASYWQCTLAPGRTAPRVSTFKRSARYMPLAHYLPARDQSVSRLPGNASASSSSSSSSSSSAAVRNRSKGVVLHHFEEPSVPVCGPDMLRGQNKMCNRTNQFILPLDRLDPAASSAAATSAAGVSRADTCNGPAVQMLRLGAMLLATAAAVLGV